MINFNGTIQESSLQQIETNRGFLFGDTVFETIKVISNKILFLEDHYFRLMASMRICRMEIPMNFTMEFIEEQIIALLTTQNVSNAYRVRFTVFRNASGFYTPSANDVQFLIQTIALSNSVYVIEKQQYEVELYKDFLVPNQKLSTLKTNNKMLQITGSIYAKENNFDTCLVLNTEKNVIEGLNSNLFMKMGSQVITPSIEDGCVNGIMRKKCIALLKKDVNISFKEESISPFDLQKADELFLTNCISGIQPITKFRKKIFETHFAKELLTKLNLDLNL
jgi:branched-chain amino acid aminotransferase